MSVLTIVSPTRFLDGIVVSLFLMLISGVALYTFGEFHKFVCVTEAAKLGMIATMFKRAFPFPKNQWSFNLTHILLFACLVCLLSMMHHPAQDCIMQAAKEDKEKEEEEEARKAKKAAKKAAEKKDE